DDQVGTEAARGSERLCAALHGFDVVVLRAQADGEEPQKPGIVVDHQDARLAPSGLTQGAGGGCHLALLGQYAARGQGHFGRPSLPGLRSLSDFSMLAMAASLALASSSSFFSFTFSPAAPSRRRLRAASWSARVASAWRVRFSASNVK